MYERAKGSRLADLSPRSSDQANDKIATITPSMRMATIDVAANATSHSLKDTARMFTSMDMNTFIGAPKCVLQIDRKQDVSFSM